MVSPTSLSFSSVVKGSGNPPAAQSHTLIQRVRLDPVIQSSRRMADRDVLVSLAPSTSSSAEAFALMPTELKVGNDISTSRPTGTLVPSPLPSSQTFKETGQSSISLASESLIQYPGYSKDVIASLDDTLSYCVPDTIPSDATASLPGWICASVSMGTPESTPIPETTIFTFPSSLPSAPPTTTPELPPSQETSLTSFFTTMSPSSPSITQKLSSAETLISSSSTLTSLLPTSQPAISSSVTTILPTSSSITNNTTSSSPEPPDTIPNTSVHSSSSSSSVISLNFPSSTSSVPFTSSFTPSSDFPTSSSSTNHLEPATTSFLSPILSTEVISILSAKPFTNGVISTSTSLEPGVLSTSNPKGPTGFARSTGAIVGVAVAGTCVLIIAVVILFLLCKRRKGRHYWSGDFRSTAGLQFTPWEPPLAGDDDAPFHPQHVRGLSNGSFQPLGSATHVSEMTPSITEPIDAEHNILRLSSSESTFSHIKSRSLTYQPCSLYDCAEKFPPNIYHSPMPPPSAWSESPNTYERSSMPSLYAAISSDGHLSNGHPFASTSSHGHSYTPTSSHGHMYPGSSSHGDMYASTSSSGHTPATSSGHGLLATNSSPPRGPLNLKSFVGRLRPGRGSLPNIIVEKMVAKSSSRHSLPSQPYQLAPTPTPSFRAGDAVSLNRPNKPTLGPIETHGLWPAATLPPLPSPANTENSRMLEDLLTPQLGTRIASSEYSSSTSLRDHVDYSRPINGAIRNIVRSTRTYSTDTLRTEIQ